VFPVANDFSAPGLPDTIQWLWAIAFGNLSLSGSVQLVTVACRAALSCVKQLSSKYAYQQWWQHEGSNYCIEQQNELVEAVQLLQGAVGFRHINTPIQLKKLVLQ
jgi:hypothetical protein